jgi:hypothetical protein
MKRSTPIMVAFYIAILSVSACGSTQQQSTEMVPSIKCPELRSEICTMDYNPVCSTLSDGSFKAYSNGCNACSDPVVVSYSPGECK